jgi:hypothetical protein
VKRRYFGRKPATAYRAVEGVHAPSTTATSTTEPSLGDLP